MKNNEGFTLIELLAVITIMGILMMVAIPTVSRTIENSRKDTFVDTAKKYSDSVSAMWSGDGLSCTTVEGVSYNSSAAPTGTYYVMIDTTSSSVPVLLEQGGKSSWGSRQVKGYVKVVVSEQTGIYGDVDHNGVVDTTDYLRISSYATDSFGFSEFEKKLCDCNKDGICNDSDAEFLRLKFINGGTFDNYHSREISYYTVMSDDIHGVNLNDNPNIVTSENLSRGDLIMAGATYDKVTLPAGALICVER